MAQESGVTLNNGDTNTILNEVPEHMAQEFVPLVPVICHVHPPQ